MEVTPDYVGYLLVLNNVHIFRRLRRCRDRCCLQEPLAMAAARRGRWSPRVGRDVGSQLLTLLAIRLTAEVCAHCVCAVMLNMQDS